nr:MAG TPA: hypothetical protein [Caudoviricetes sp.]
MSCTPRRSRSSCWRSSSTTRTSPGASTTPSAAPAPRWPPARHTANPPTPWS